MFFQLSFVKNMIVRGPELTLAYHTARQKIVEHQKNQNLIQNCPWEKIQVQMDAVALDLEDLLEQISLTTIS